MRRTTQAMLLLTLVVGLPLSAARAASNAHVLLKAYFQYEVVRQVADAVDTMTIPAEARQEITAAHMEWQRRQQTAIKTSLEVQMGQEAKANFEFFVAGYTRAEKEVDMSYLAALQGQLALDPAPESFVALRHIVVSSWLADSIRETGEFLSELQTWTDLVESRGLTISLRQWLERNKSLPLPPPTPTQSLAAAEPGLPKFVDTQEGAPGALTTYGALHDKRQQQVLTEAKTYMQQIADERKIVEDEVAQKQSAAAQREAAAINAQAQKLADVESEAMEQRKHTWQARVSKVLTATVGGAFSAVTSGIGGAAGAAAAAAIFDTE